MFFPEAAYLPGLLFRLIIASIVLPQNRFFIWGHGCAPTGRMAERSKALASLSFFSHAGSNPAPSTNAVMRLVYNLGLEYKPEEFFGAIPNAARLAGDSPRLFCPHSHGQGSGFFLDKS